MNPMFALTLIKHGSSKKRTLNRLRRSIIFEANYASRFGDFTSFYNEILYLIDQAEKNIDVEYYLKQAQYLYDNVPD